MKVARVVGVVSVLLSCVEEKDDRGTESGASQGSEESSDGESSTSTSTGEATTTGETTTSGGASVQPEVCAQMFACLVNVAPEVAAPLLALYGEDGSCWLLGANEQAICVSACEGQLQIAYETGLWDQQVCGGVFQPEVAGTKGPEDTDVKCSDMFDNDGDLYVDCDDFDCSMNRGVTVCGGGTG